MPDLAITPLDDLTALAVRGPDAANFLQGQVSQDMERLAARGALLAGLHNPQGRCLALLRLFHLGSDQILIVLPAELAPDVRTLLARFILRAKVRIEDVGTAWRIYGLAGPDAEAAATTRIHMALDQEGFRQLILAPRGEPLPQGHATSRADWRIEDIEAGLPEVLGPTAGEFVAQMLNLDALDAISFDKGCYTGQEIIARAHYRGQVKRRMQLFHTESPVMLLPGERIALGDGRRAQVVLSEAIEEGGQEFLAVTTLPGTAPTEPAATDPDGAGAPARIQAMQMPLPYPLPH
jgi:folate-binding protein YgfZ